MRNKISIDELVRQKVARGEEPHNLGSWANMERMLNGENPYQEEDKKKRRPWLFMLLGFLVASTAVVGGYTFLSNASTDQNNSTLVASSPSAAVENGIATPNTDSDKEISKSTNSDNKEQNANDEVILASTNTNSAMQEVSRPRFPITKNKNTPARNRTKSIFSKPTNTIAKRSNANASVNTDVLENERQKNNKAALEAANKLLENKTAALDKVSPTIEEKYFDTTKVIEVSKNIKKDNAGNEYYASDSFKYNLVQEKTRTVINPRFVKLTQEQEEAAQRRTALASSETNISIPKNNLFEEENNSNKIVLSNAKKEASISTKEKEGFFSIFKKVSTVLRQKSINLAHTRTPIYTGMFMGVNSALVNSKHNFGGFQGGFTAMTPLSKRLTLRTEARFVHQRNGGYTITDNKHVIKNMYIDSSSIFKSKIYNYDIDSVGYGYNLQNFYSVQVPVLLNANFNKFSVYGGLNVNYGFRMNINTTTKSHFITASDTVASSQNYIPRTGTDTKFVRDDFASRLGLGYTIGGAYNFNPSLYIDLRMSSQIWDNGLTAAQKDISNVFFKIPSFQLSVGYRFRKFGKED